MRRQSREIAVQSLYQMEYAPQVRLEELIQTAEAQLDKESIQYAKDLLAGVVEKKSEIDNRIQGVAQHWKLERMAGVDRNILRLAVFELEFSAVKTDAAVIINEALEIAKKFSTTESASFINGLLDQIRKGH